MPLTDEQIQECTQRYIREYDRYSKMADLVYQKCLDIVQKKLTVRATVQRRAKSPKSFSDKLKKSGHRNRYDSVDQVFSTISDLAGVRIATYLESDREQVVDEIKKEFVGKENDGPAVDVKDRSQQGRHYRATHCQVYLTEEDLTGSNENLKGTTCEIQVCSLLAHVFNEIEHDLQYKPLSGDLSEAEQEFIDQLGLLTKAGDLTIKRLLSETDERLSQRTGEFDDVHDFVARMRKELQVETDFSANAGQLYEELEALQMNSPGAIHEAVCPNGENLKDISSQEYQRLKAYANSKSFELLEEGSSDLLLAGILKSKVKEILKRHPMGRAKGRPSRLAQIAKLYKQMSDDELTSM
ncbi:GTP pyrophosphokinase [Aeromonas bivalvium]|uniref:GTP pyrophosphokinase n=1 Tax=Aeromonas bivalvium TaxID=440079 RepID=UPI0038CF8F79